jgi:hypothetical protein
MSEKSRAHAVIASVLLACAAVFIAVALSQWLVGAGLDPRDTFGSRAAGLGFTDEARGTLFSIVPVALPAVAVWLRPVRVIRRLALMLYGLYLVIGVSLTLSAARYGFDEAGQVAAQGAVWIDGRAATERLALDGVWLLLALMGALFARRARSRE